MRWKNYLMVAMLASTAAACEDTTGTDETGQARVFLSSSTATSSDFGSELLASVMGNLSVDQVDSLFVRVTSISALRQSADTAEGSGGWVTIQLADSGGKRINLFDLPVAGLDSISLARGELTAGRYKNIRLQFDSAAASIMLNEEVTVGNHTFKADTLYSLRIPSGVLKTSANFTIGEDSLSTVHLVFNPEASVGNIVATGSGQLQMSPVIHKK